MATKLTQIQVLKKIQEHPVGKVKVAITDMDGVLRGKYIHTDKFESAMQGGFGFCNVVFGWDINDLSYEGIDYTGWHTGYPDASATIDTETFRQVPWDNDVPFLLADFSNDTNGAQNICPRSLLKKVRAKANDMGFQATFAQEYEWFNFNESPESLQEKYYVNPQPITPGMFGYSLIRSSRNNEFFNELFDLLAKFRVPIEGLHTETGPGVYEAAILYSDILEAADRSTLFRSGVKEIAMRHNIMPSFMAKWSEKLPGCSGHIHQSLWQDGKNCFYDESADNNMSETMRSYLAGQLLCLPHLLPMYAPLINSYKRLVEGAWAPTTLTWGMDNRTTAIRALPGSEKATRIEFRVTGSDMNPYLAMAAALASGLYGIEKGLKLETPMTTGNGYTDKSNGSLPSDLQEATNLMRKSEIANELLGESFVKHFCQTRDWEWKQHLKAVTDWEIRRYFEIV